MASTAMKPTLCRLKAYCPRIAEADKELHLFILTEGTEGCKKAKETTSSSSSPSPSPCPSRQQPRPERQLPRRQARRQRRRQRRPGFLGGASDDGRHGEVALGGGRLDALGQGDGRDMNRVADLEAGQVDLEMLGDGVGRAAHRDLVAHDVEDAAALEARGGGFVQEAHRHLDSDERILADAHEVDMDGEVANGIELHVARDHPRLLAVDVEGEDGALEVTGMELRVDRAVVDGDGLRRCLVAIENAGDAPLAARRARPAFAGARPRPCLEFDRLSHEIPPIEIMKGRRRPHRTKSPLKRSRCKLSRLIRLPNSRQSDNRPRRHFCGPANP